VHNHLQMKLPVFTEDNNAPSPDGRCQQHKMSLFRSLAEQNRGLNAMQNREKESIANQPIQPDNSQLLSLGIVASEQQRVQDANLFLMNRQIVDEEHSTMPEGHRFMDGRNITRRGRVFIE
jgi:hypothetical protein